MNDPRYNRRADATLILSPDPLTAALVGAAAELAGFRAEFARSSETLRDDLRRVRPSHVLLDCDDPSLRDEGLAGPVLMMAARLFFFGSREGADEVRELAQRLGARLIVLPGDITRVREILTRRPSPVPEQLPVD